MHKTCLTCGGLFIPKYKHNKNRFCSQKCYWEFKKGLPPWNVGTKGVCKPNSGSFQKGCKPWHAGKKGVKEAPSTAFKKGHSLLKGRTGEKHPAWKGDEVGKIGVHTWITKTYGKPHKCEHCGVTKKDGKKISWANKGHTYKRNRKDWFMLCSKCHWHYDNPS